MLHSITILDILNKVIEPMSINTALEVGTGKGGILNQLKVPCKLGVDHYAPDLFTAVENTQGIIVIKHDIRKLMDLFLPKSVEMVIVFDVLEHFEPDAVPKIIEMVELLATRLVVFWFPVEKVLSGNPLPENPSQEHKALLRIEDFDARGYELMRFPHYWRIPREDPGVDGCLCFKKVGV